MGNSYTPPLSPCSFHGIRMHRCSTWWFPWLSMTFPWIFHDISIYSHHTGNIRTIVLTDFMENPCIPHGIHVFLMEFHEFPMGYSWVISIREVSAPGWLYCVVDVFCFNNIQILWTLCIGRLWSTRIFRSSSVCFRIHQPGMMLCGFLLVKQLFLMPVIHQKYSSI